MHIVLFHFYSSDPNPVYQEIAAALRRRGHVVWVGAPNRSGDLEWRDGEQVVATKPGPMSVPPWMLRIPLLVPLWKRFSSFRFALEVRTFLRLIGPHIAQVNLNSFAWVVPLGMPDKVHFVYDVRQINERVSSSLVVRAREQGSILVRKACARFFYEHTCFCHLEAARRILGSNWSTRGTVIPVGLDPRFLTLERFPSTQLDRTDCVRFIYVGTVSRHRVLEKLLYAVRRLLTYTDRFQLDLVGPDVAQGYYHDLVDSLGIASVAAVKPPVPYESIPELISSYDVGIAYVPHRPTWDYQPAIKVLEYRALGLPMISTDVAAHREFVTDGVNGFLVDDSVESWAEAMRQFVVDRDLLRRLGANAQAMRQGVTWDEVAMMYEKVYVRLEQQSHREKG